MRHPLSSAQVPWLDHHCRSSALALHVPEAVDPAVGQQFAEPGPLLRKETRLGVAFGVPDVVFGGAMLRSPTTTTGWSVSSHGASHARQASIQRSLYAWRSGPPPPLGR